MKCPKYNGPHKIKNNRDIAWCCKANFKTNLYNLNIKIERVDFILFYFLFLYLGLEFIIICHGYTYVDFKRNT